MKVRVLNPEVLENLYKNHGDFACICYDTPHAYAEKVGKSCQNTKHMSGSRCEYIKFEITDIDRGTAEQCLRHEIGTAIPFEMMDNYTFEDMTELYPDINPSKMVKNMASFRYIDKAGFSWDTPKNIKNNAEANAKYDALMVQINETRKEIKDILLAAGVNEKKAVEDSNFILPRATTTGFVIGLTPEALIHFCHKRLCKRAQEFIQEVAKQMKQEVEKHNPEFAKELKPHCQHLLWCPEGERFTCKAYPTKAQLIEVLKDAKRNT